MCGKIKAEQKAWFWVGWWGGGVCGWVSREWVERSLMCWKMKVLCSGQRNVTFLPF